MGNISQIISKLKRLNYSEILNNKWVTRFLYTLGALILLALVLNLSLRNVILRNYLDKKIEIFNNRYHAEIKIGKARFSGLAGIQLDDVSLKAKDKDTLVKFSRLSVRVSLWKIMLGRIKTKEFNLNDFYLKVVKSDSNDNFSFLLNSEKDTIHKDTSSLRMAYSELFNNLLRLVFDFIPSKVDINNFNIAFQLPGESLNYHSDNFKIEEKYFKTIININENDSLTSWCMDGSLDKDKMQLSAKLYSKDTSFVRLPYISRRIGMKLLFDTLLFRFNAELLNSDMVKLSTVASVRGLNINHPRISKEDVKISQCSFFYNINIGSDYFEIDSSSYISLNRLTFNPFLKIRPKPSMQISFHINKENFNAEELFESLPDGLFENLQGLEASGQLSYHLNFFVDMKAVDSLKFVSKLTRKDFRIVKYGRTNLSKMSGPFEYTAYEKGQAVKTFEVGPGNPDFRSYDQISPYLINAVLLCEDNGFPWHNGFLLEAFRGAIIENIKKGRFARGGSTITMQLVKNVFLNRNKTVVRKLEEMMIVWLIESNHLTSKNRMFEVYLNIIEWGPLVYGANSASHFYFKKDVSQLTIPEAIFMASIIPRPKYYQYCFDSGQVLKPYFIEHMNLIAGKMLKKEVISQDEFDRFIPVIKITGPARVKFIKADTINIFQLEPED